MDPKTTSIYGSHASQGIGYSYSSNDSSVSNEDFLKKKLKGTSIHDAAKDHGVQAAMQNMQAHTFAFNS